MTRTKRMGVLLLVATLLAAVFGYRTWLVPYRESVARLAAEKRSGAEWDRLQAIETERLARELQASLQLARNRLEQIVRRNDGSPEKPLKKGQ